MDATAQLALMAKAKLVFETPGTFLNFPVLAPLSFPPSSLDFSQAAQDPAVAAALQDFSRAVNSCPVGSVSSGDGDDYLWDRYDSWLTAMTLAKSQLDPEDQAAYTAARAILMITDSNGFDADSPMVVAYKQCRDAAYAAQQAYTSAELTATSSGSSTALTTWQTVDEPRLRAAIAAAQADWANAGHKSDVESAQGTVARGVPGADAAGDLGGMAKALPTRHRLHYGPGDKLVLRTQRILAIRSGKSGMDDAEHLGHGDCHAGSGRAAGVECDFRRKRHFQCHRDFIRIPLGIHCAALVEHKRVPIALLEISRRYAAQRRRVAAHGTMAGLHCSSGIRA
jgi:hypothetical protein